LRAPGLLAVLRRWVVVVHVAAVVSSAVVVAVDVGKSSFAVSV